MTDQVSETMRSELVITEPEPVIEKLTGLKLYNAFKKTLPKGTPREEVSQKWIDHKISLGMKTKEKKPKKEPKEPKEPKEKKVRKLKVVKFENSIGDFPLGPIPVMCQ